MTPEPEDGHEATPNRTWLQRGGRLGVAAGRGFLNVVLPPVCPITGERVSAAGLLSASAWSGLSFITDPQCRICGRPFSYEIDHGAVCGACMAEPPVFDALRSALVYDDASAALVLRLKHGDHTDGVRQFGQWMARAIGNALSDDGGTIDYVAPVPLHFLRLMRRQFNQSALLAQALAGELSVPCAPRLLTRVRRTPPQKGLTGAQRRENVRGAFRVSPSWADRLDGASVLLVDDVYTTGATVQACCLALRRAGVAAITVAALARVVRADYVNI